MTDTPLELAKMLQNSNIVEVSTLAKGYLALEVAYQELKHAYTMRVAGEIMVKHEKLFKRLAESGD